MRAGRIAAIGDALDAAALGAGDAEVVSLGGRWVIAGPMNAHAHACLDGGPDPETILHGENRTQTVVRSIARLEATLRAGVTTIRDVGGPGDMTIELAAADRRGRDRRPRMLASGRVITMTGGHGWWIGRQADGPDAVRRATRKNLRAGATSIKLMATGGMMTTGRQAGQPQLTIEEMAAAVEEAHEREVPVAAHAESRVGVRNAILAGVDWWSTATAATRNHGHDARAGDRPRADDHVRPPDHRPRGRRRHPGLRRPAMRGLAREPCRVPRTGHSGRSEIAAGNDGGAPLVRWATWSTSSNCTSGTG